MVAGVAIGRRFRDVLESAKIVVFDFDGVILESVDVKTQGYRTMYAGHGDAVADQVVAHHKENSGVSRFEKFRLYHKRFLGIDLDDNGVAALADQFGRIVEDLVVACPFVPGAEETLHHLAATGHRPHIASATPQDELERIIQRRGLRNLFGRVHGAPLKKVDVLRAVAEAAGISPSQVLMVGDAPQDRLAAQAAGVAFVLRIVPTAVSLFPGDVPSVPDLYLNRSLAHCGA